MHKRKHILDFIRGLIMNNNIIINDDVWKLESKNKSYVKKHIFDFRYLENKSFKKQIKELVFELIKRDIIESSTLYVYYGIIRQYFLPFLSSEYKEINYFSEVDKILVERYIIYFYINAAI